MVVRSPLTRWPTQPVIERRYVYGKAHNWRGLEADKDMTDRNGELVFDSENLVLFGHVDRRLGKHLVCRASAARLPRASSPAWS
jgi:hypothetical protein